MMVAWLVLLVALVGVVLFSVTANPKVERIGLVLFACGTLVCLFALQGHTVRLP